MKTSVTTARLATLLVLASSSTACGAPDTPRAAEAGREAPPLAERPWDWSEERVRSAVDPGRAGYPSG